MSIRLYLSVLVGSELELVAILWELLGNELKLVVNELKLLGIV